MPMTARLSLPPIALDELPEGTKDFLLAKANRDGVPPMQALKDTLDRAASKAGFRVKRA